MSSKNKHLSFSDRSVIERKLNNHATRAAIGQALGKDPTTISKEISRNRTRYSPKLFQDGLDQNKCATKDCQLISGGCPWPDHEKFAGKCLSPCADPVYIPCRQRDKYGVCNGCTTRRSCPLVQYLYKAETAQQAYEEKRSASRSGTHATPEELKNLADIIKPPLDQGQSIQSILISHPEIKLSLKTIYNYINQGLLEPYGIERPSSRQEIVGTSGPQAASFPVRKDKAYLEGRKPEDFSEWLEKQSIPWVWQMDIIYNDCQNGPFIQTFVHRESLFMFAVYHEEKTAKAMTEGVRFIRQRIGNPLFHTFFSALLANRGTEFSNAQGFEKLGTRIFYCNSQSSWPKADVNNCHTVLRFVLPKKENLHNLGLHSQHDLDLILSHINSLPRKSRLGQSALDLFNFYTNSPVLAAKLGITKIDPECIVLQPELIKKKV